jgi:uncharacterized membrane protein
MRRQHAPELAIGIGVVAGLRPMSALALIAWGLRRGWIRPGHSPYTRIVSASASKRIAEFAISELIADKLPFTRSRLDVAPLTWRILSGAICGAIINTKRPPDRGAVLGGLGALAGAATGYHIRRRLGRDMPDLIVALLEDAVALGAGASIVILESAAK